MCLHNISMKPISYYIIVNHVILLLEIISMNLVLTSDGGLC